MSLKIQQQSVKKKCYCINAAHGCSRAPEGFERVSERTVFRHQRLDEAQAAKEEKRLQKLAARRAARAAAAAAAPPVDFDFEQGMDVEEGDHPEEVSPAAGQWTACICVHFVSKCKLLADLSFAVDPASVRG
jgi:hypothetical protein